MILRVYTDEGFTPAKNVSLVDAKIGTYTSEMTDLGTLVVTEAGIQVKDSKELRKSLISENTEVFISCRVAKYGEKPKPKASRYLIYNYKESKEELSIYLANPLGKAAKPSLFYYDREVTLNAIIAGLTNTPTENKDEQKLLFLRNKKQSILTPDMMRPHKQEKVDDPTHIIWSGDHVMLSGKGFDSRWAWLGISRLPKIKSIENPLSSNSSPTNAMREVSTNLQTTTQLDEVVIINVEFPNILDGDPIYNQEEELRTLIAQLRVCPFLPILWNGRATQSVEDIDALVINQVVINTMEGFPNVYQVQIMAAPFNWSFYLKDPDKTCFADYFVWPVFELYIQNVAQTIMPQYVTDSSVNIKMSVADEAKMATANKFLSKISSKRTGNNVEGEVGSNLNPQERMKSALDDIEADKNRALAKPVYMSISDFFSKGATILAEAPIKTVNEVDVAERYRTRIRIDSEYLLKASKVKRLISELSVKYNGITIYETNTLISGARTSQQSKTFLNNESPFPGTYEILDESDWELLKKAIIDTATKDKTVAELKDMMAGVKTDNSFYMDPKNREYIPITSAITSGAQIVMSHVLTQIPTPGFLRPTYQFWGSMDIQVSLNVSSNQGLGDIKEVITRSIAQGRRFKPLSCAEDGSEPGFIAVETKLLGLLGMKFFQVRTFNAKTAEAMPERVEGQLVLSLFTDSPQTLQSNTRKLTDALVRELRSENVASSRIAGMMATEQRLETIPLYPDLCLPTYKELRSWVSNAITPKGYKLDFVAPFGAHVNSFVDPDFFINCYTLEQLIDVKHTIKNMNLEISATSRQVDEKAVVISVEDKPQVDWLQKKPSGSTMVALSKEATAEERTKAAVEMGSESTLHSEDYEDEHNDLFVPTELENVRASFDDFQYRSQYNRLVRAYPTFMLLFYREGVTMGIVRMWDQFNGRMAVTSLSTTASTEKPDSTLVVSMADPNTGIGIADLEASTSVDKEQPDFRGAISHTTLGGLWGESFTEWWKESVQDPFTGTGGGGGINPVAVRPDMLRRWTDLSNLLVASPGSRVHARVGYGSRASCLPIVFNGTVSDCQIGINGIQLSAAGDGIEMAGELYPKTNSDKNTKVKPEWEGARPRLWFRDVLTNYKSGVQIVDRSLRYGDNIYGIRHFGSPIPTRGMERFASRFSVMSAKDFDLWLPKFNGSELMENIYSSSLSWPGGDSVDGADINEQDISRFQEGKFTLNTQSKSFFDIAQELAGCCAGYVAAVRPYGIFRSTFFFGRPHWPIAYQYVYGDDLLNRRRGSSYVRGMLNRDPRWNSKFNDGANSASVTGLFSYLQLTKTFSQVHFIDDSYNLMHMGLSVDGEGVKTRLRLFGLKKDGEWCQTAAGGFMPGTQAIVLNVDEDIYPEVQKEEAVATPFRWKWGSGNWGRDSGEVWGQEYLAKTIRTMYNGHIVITGDGTVNPWDMLVVNDKTTAIEGTCMVREVSHHVGMGSGFVTDIVPGAIAWGARARRNTTAVIGQSALGSIIGGELSIASMMSSRGIESIKFLRGQTFRILAGLKSLSGLDFSDEIKKLEEILDKTTGVMATGIVRKTASDLVDVIDSFRRKVMYATSLDFRRIGTLLKVTSGQLVDPADVISAIIAIRERIEKIDGNVSTGINNSYASTEAFIDSWEEKVQTRLKQTKGATKAVHSDRERLKAIHTTFKGGAAAFVAGAIVAPWTLAVSIMAMAVLLPPIILASKGVSWCTGRNPDGVNIVLLHRGGRELQAGLTGHKGAVVGESASAHDEMRRRARKWLALKGVD